MFFPSANFGFSLTSAAVESWNFLQICLNEASVLFEKQCKVFFGILEALCILNFTGHCSKYDFVFIGTSERWVFGILSRFTSLVCRVFAMELCPSSLQARLKLEPRLQDREVYKIIFCLLDFLEFLHDLGVVHRDLKCLNIGVNNSCDVRVSVSTVDVLCMCALFSRDDAVFSSVRKLCTIQ